MPIQTPIRGLRSFCVASKCLSFKHAAAQLFLTPSAVSHQIKQLEEQLGFVLLKEARAQLSLRVQENSFISLFNRLFISLNQLFLNLLIINKTKQS